jgi:DNA-binding NarL/FixJ family response regulator
MISPIPHDPQATSMIKSKASYIADIGLSMHGGKDKPQSMYAAGANEYLKKTFGQALIAAIRNMQFKTNSR